MIRTQVHHSTENASKYQAVNPYFEEINSAGKESSEGLGAGDEFSSIMDKIAARFSQNLGFDYTTLLASGSVQAAQVAAVKPEPKKPENKESVKPEDAPELPEAQEHSSSEFRAEVKATRTQEKAEDKSEKSSEKEIKAEVKAEAKEVKSEEKSSEEVKVKPVVEPKEGKAAQASDVAKLVTSETAPETSQVAKTAAEEGDQTETSEAPEAVDSKSDKAVKASAKKAGSEVSKENTETEAPEEIAPETSDIVKTLDNQQEAATKETAAKGTEAKAAAAASSTSVLTELFLNASFLSKEIAGAQSSQNTANSQAVKNITDVVKDKIVTSMNNALSNNNLNLGGSFSTKANSERAEAVKEKVYAQQPQMLKAFEKVESALKEAAKARDGKTISLRLDPPSLGTVKVDVSLKDGSLHARVSADNQTVNSMMREYSHDLQLALRKLGLNVERITVSINNSNHETDFGHNLGGNYQQAASDKNNKEQTGAGFVSENNFGLGSEILGNEIHGHTENAQLDHWVA